MAGRVALITWNKNLLFSLLGTFLNICLFIFISFCFFVIFGIFIPLKVPITFSVFIFILMVMFRFFHSTTKQSLYEMVGARVFAPSLLKKLSQKNDWQQPQIIRNGVIMVLFPKRLPQIGQSKETAVSYTKIYNKYLSLLFSTIEQYEGCHDVLSKDGIIAFWNAPLEQEDSEYKAFSCANDCIDAVKKWQRYIDANYLDKKYTAAFDICLHRCDFYAGCLDAGNIQNYVISGSEINFAISVAQSQTSDKKSTILITRNFWQAIKHRIVNKKVKDIKIIIENSEHILLKFN